MIKTNAQDALLELTNDSGHYKPVAACLFNVLHKLKTDGYAGSGQDLGQGYAVQALNYYPCHGFKKFDVFTPMIRASLVFRPSMPRVCVCVSK